MTDLLTVTHNLKATDNLIQDKDSAIILKKCNKISHRKKRQVDTRKLVCGRATVKPRDSSTRIVGGFQATPHSFPWTVSIQQLDSHRCGATLLPSTASDRSQYVLSAAHCFYGLNNVDLTVKIGAHDLNKNEERAVIRNVKKIIVHPNYDEDTVANDISLIQLEEPVMFSETIQPICLPKSNEVFKAKTICIAAGWGAESEGGSSSGKLMQVELPIIDFKECNGKKYFYNGTLKEKEMICAGYLKEGGKDACQGDSGGPLITKQKDAYVLPGVVSFGEGCARKGAPGIYTRVSNYITWINQMMKTMSAETTTTTTTTTTKRFKPWKPWKPKPKPWQKPWWMNNNFYG